MSPDSQRAKFVPAVHTAAPAGGENSLENEKGKS
eukprot:gene43296-21139_t